jgi:hypothetical protein
MKNLMWVLIAIVFAAGEPAFPQCMDSTWISSPGSINSDFGTGAVLAADGDAVVCGYYDYTGLTQGYGWLLKYDPQQGSTSWARTYSHNGAQSIFHDVVRTGDNGYACMGWMRMPVTNQQHYWLFRMNSNGDSLWSRIYGNNTLPFQGKCVVQAPDGGFGLAGRAHSLPGGFGSTDWLLIKTNSDGDSLWSVLIGEPDEETCQEMILTQDGSFLMMGNFATDSSRNGRLAKVNQAGEIVWNHTYLPSPALDIDLASAALAPDGGFIVCGQAQNGNDDNDVLIFARG